MRVFVPEFLYRGARVLVEVLVPGYEGISAGYDGISAGVRGCKFL